MGCYEAKTNKTKQKTREADFPLEAHTDIWGLLSYQNVCSFLPSQVPALMGVYLESQLFEELLV